MMTTDNTSNATEPAAIIADITAAAAAVIAALPPLTGSPKQIDWANQIRLHYAESFLRYHEEQSAYQHPGATAAGMQYGFPILVKILAIRESEFWINGMRRKIAGESIAVSELVAERWIARHSYK